MLQCSCQRAHMDATPRIYRLRMFDYELLCKVEESVERSIVKGRSTRHGNVRGCPIIPVFNRVQPETCCVMWFARI